MPHLYTVCPECGGNCDTPPIPRRDYSCTACGRDWWTDEVERRSLDKPPVGLPWAPYAYQGGSAYLPGQRPAGLKLGVLGAVEDADAEYQIEANGLD